MPNFDRAIFLADEASQILALGDALLSMNESAITSAFADVARHRGLAAMASDANISIEALERALAVSDRPDVNVLQHVFTALARLHADIENQGDCNE